MTNHTLRYAVAALVVGGLVVGVGQLSPASAQTITVPAEDKLIVTDPNPNARAGQSVAISGDTAVVGAPFDDNAGNDNTGAAYVYVRSGNDWTLQARLTHGGNEDVEFGASVAISGDTIVVGAPRDDVTAAGTDGCQGTPLSLAYRATIP
jgi:hypothetical protein